MLPAVNDRRLEQVDIPAVYDTLVTFPGKNYCVRKRSPPDQQGSHRVSMLVDYHLIATDFNPIGISQTGISAGHG